MIERTNNSRLLQLRRLQDECIGIFIGAGTSSDSIESIKVPQWSELLSEMLSGLRLEKSEPSPNEYLAIAGLIEKHMKEEIIESIQIYFSDVGIVYPEHVYADIVQSIATARMAEYIYFLLTKYPFSPDDAKLKENSTLDAIIKVCTKRVEQKKQTVIVNYNFDDFLEYFLKEEIGESNIEIHFYQGNNSNLEGGVAALLRRNKRPVNIIYVHGKVNLLTQDKIIPFQPSLIISQQNYDTLFQTVVNFTNQLQYLIMLSIPSIAIGFSCDDPNFRQLRNHILSTNGSLPPFFVLKFCESSDSKCPNENNCVQNMRVLKEMLELYGLIPIIANRSVYTSTIENLFGLSTNSIYCTLQCNR